MLASNIALARDLTRLGSDGFCASAAGILAELRSLLLPPEKISTTECAVRFRYLKNMEGTGKRLWSLARTPYMAEPQDALDKPKVRLVVFVGPERSGKSVGGENHLFKRLRHGPLTDTIVYLQAGSDVDSYADKEFADLIGLHPEIGSALGTHPSDRKRKFKRIKGRAIQILPANDGNLRQREAPFIIASEIDGYKRVAAKAVQEIRGRLKSFGLQAKGYIESHPDLGWDAGIAPAWKEGSRGVFYMRCPHCKRWSTPHQLAPKGMRLVMHYDRDDAVEEAERLARAAASAVAVCPHGGCLIDDDERYAMIDGGAWAHHGQTVDAERGVEGDAEPNETASYWLHGLNVKRPLGPLAQEHLSSTLHFERTRKPDRIKRFQVKSLGEVYEGASGKPTDATALRERAKSGFVLGTVPPEVLFVTGAVDVGGSKFDVGFWGWDLEGRSWLVDRFTIRERTWADGQARELRPAERQEDWAVVEALLRRKFPIVGTDSVLPLAGLAIDSGDGNVTAKASEFARQMAVKGHAWGGWRKVRLIKGAGAVSAVEVPANANDLVRTDAAKAVQLGVHKLKTLSVERLAVDDDGPGQCYFADGLPRSAFDEFAGEVLIDGKWQRRGANETLDLFGYAEAVRQMLQPDRSDIKWALRRPIWARPIEQSARAFDEAPTEKISTRDRLAALNRRS